MSPKPSAAIMRLVLAAAAVATLTATVGCAKDTTAPEQSTDTTNRAGQVAVSVPAKSQQPKMGGSLTYGIEAETDGFDPTSNRWAISGLLIANAVFDPIAAFDENKQPQPYLAEKFEPSADFKQWTIKGRPNIKFQNGQPLDSAAAKKFTLAIKNSLLTGPAARPIDTVDIVDNLTIRINMTQPWVAFPALLTGQGGLIPAPEQLDRSAAKDPAASTQPIGTGPFVFKDYIRDSKFVATKNPDYWQKDGSGQTLPYLDSITFRPIPDGQSRVSSLLNGDIDVMHDSNYNKVELLKAQADAGNIQYFQGGGEDEETFAMINVQEEPLKDKSLRQALAYATNRQEIDSITGAPPEQDADSPFSKDGDWYVDPNFPKFDLAKATSLVDAWKAANGGQAPKFTFSTTPEPDNTRVAQALQEQWKQAGFDVTLETGEQTKIILNAVTAQYQAVLFRQFSAPDPDGETHWWLGVNAAPKGQLGLNFARINDPALDAALYKGRSSPNLADRKAAYADVAKIFADLVPYVWLSHTRWNIATTNDVRDILNQRLPVANPDGTVTATGAPSLPVQAGVHRITYAWKDV
ncbi:MAG: hypothetical protein HYX32_01445 [Actinobacteria bacterium]|nr:hypothetical protein [Actinomycetota bacterium]